MTTHRGRIPMKQRHTYREIGLFGGLTVGLSALFYALILLRGGIESGGSMVAGIMLTPGLAAIATQLIMKRTLRGLGWRIRLDRYLAAGYLLPAIYCLVAYTMV